MKALFIGLGSIGQRHLDNYNKLKLKESSVIAYREKFSNKIIKDTNIVSGDSLQHYYGFKEFRNFELAISEKPDIAFICNPSSMHLDTALKIAERGIHFFVEKPLCTNKAGLEKLKKIVKEKKIVSMVGYQMRFHPILRDIKKVIKKKLYGNIVSASFHWGTYLPNHHKYENYKKGYAAKRSLGGGVIFSLIHELDIIQWLFALPLDVYASIGAPSNLGIEAEDNVIAQFRCENIDKSIFPVALNLSFSQGLESRNFSILFQDALLKCDLIKNDVSVTDHDNVRVYNKNINSFYRNRLFIDELDHFIFSVENKINTSVPIDEGEKSLSMALAMHESINYQDIINIKK